MKSKKHTKPEMKWLMLYKEDITIICDVRPTSYFIKYFGNRNKFLNFVMNGYAFEDKYIIVEDK